MGNSNGKSGILIVILSAIILLAAVPWVFLISNYFSQENIPESTTTLNGESTHAGSGSQAEQTPEPVLSPEPGDSDDPDSNQGDQDASPIELDIQSIADINPELARELNAIASDYDCVAVSMVVFDGDTGEFFSYEFGRADLESRRRVDVDTKFRMASLSKLTTVICAMALVDDGLIDLDTDISTYFGYEVKNTNFPGTSITVRMLMQHTSSIFDSGAFQESRDRDSSESVRFLLDRGSSFRRNQPGTVFEYSNFGYSVLGSLCERVSGKSIDALAREVIFDPLGIDAAYVPERLSDTENIAVIYNERHNVTRSVQAQLDVGESSTMGHDLHLAQGNLTISAVDFARILAMLGNRGVLDDTVILSAESVRVMLNTADVGASFRQGLAVRQSVGDLIEGVSFYWHTGSAFGLFSQFIYNSQENKGVVVVTTGAKGELLESSMIDVCTDLSLLAWSIFDIDEEE
jgi:CubicO group peptidase (beta-lactamase class C family)